MFKDRRGIGIDSEDDTYKPSSLGFRVQRSTKQQRRMSVFVNSGVMIVSSQDDSVVPVSILSTVGWIIRRRSEDVEDRVSEVEIIVEGVVVDERADSQSEDLFEPEFGWRYRGSD